MTDPPGRSSAEAFEFLARRKLGSYPRRGFLMASEGQSKRAPEGVRAPSRVVIEGVQPAIDHGRFPVKRTAGEDVSVIADVLADGHDVLAVVLRYRRREADAWNEVGMSDLGNDRWSGRFTVMVQGHYEYAVQ